MSATILQFEPETHEYKRNGFVVPSVTQVLHKAGFIDTKYMTELGRWRGSYCHLACEYDDRDELDESTMRPEMLGYLAGWRKFRLETGFVPTEIEYRVLSNEWGYAGILDRIGTLRSGKKVLLDIKTGALLDYCRMQLAAYLNCLPDPFLYERMAVRITDKGGYKCKPYPMSNYTRDRDEFLRALTEQKKEIRCQQS